MHLKILSAKWPPFCSGRDELKYMYGNSVSCHSFAPGRNGEGVLNFQTCLYYLSCRRAKFPKIYSRQCVMHCCMFFRIRMTEYIYAVVSNILFFISYIDLNGQTVHICSSEEMEQQKMGFCLSSISVKYQLPFSLYGSLFMVAVIRLLYIRGDNNSGGCMLTFSI